MRRLFAQSIAASAIVVTSAQAQVWVGPTAGPWSDPTNWDTSTVPNSPFADVSVDSADVQNTVVHLDTTALVRSLEVTANDVLNFDQNSSLAVLGNSLAASVNNAGTIVIGQRADLLSTATTLSLVGGGSLRLEGSTARLGGSGRIVNVDNNITGDGQIGANAIEFSNEHLIDASTTGQALILDPGPAGANAFFNSGTLRASTGWLLLTGNGGGDFANNGTFDAAGGTIALIADARVVGGIFQTSFGGRAQVSAGNAASISAFTNNGHFVVDGGSTLSVSGSIVNNGSIELAANGVSSFLDVDGSVSFSGSGGVALNQSNAGTAGIASQASATITNGAGHTIRGAGVAVDNQNLNNNGKITADISGATLLVAPHAGVQVNNGEFRSTNGGIFLLTGQNGATIGGSGAIRVDTGAAMRLTNSAQVALSGNTVADGTLSVIGSSSVSLAGVTGGGTVQIDTAARLTAQHIRVATLDIDAGSAVIRAGGGTLGTSKVKSLTVSSSLDLTDHALLVDYTGSSPVNAIANLLQSGYANGDWNGAGIVSSIAAADPARRTAVGYAESTQVAAAVPGIFEGQSFDSTTVITAFTLYGDANLDFRVNLDDFTALAARFGGAGRWAQGDFNYNGAVNLDDFTALAANFGVSLPLQVNVSTTTAVPEPVAAVVWLGVGLLLRARRVRGGRGAV